MRGTEKLLTTTAGTWREVPARFFDLPISGNLPTSPPRAVGRAFKNKGRAKQKFANYLAHGATLVFECATLTSRWVYQTYISDSEVQLFEQFFER